LGVESPDPSVPFDDWEVPSVPTLETSKAGLSRSNYYLNAYLAYSWARLESSQTC
jgi:hypothetical protein